MQTLNCKISKKLCIFAPKLKKMGILYVFNPEHDLALASNLANFTAPHAGRKLRSDLGYLPALWATADDYILVENVEQARKAYGRLRARVGGGQRQFVDKNQLRRLEITGVTPWGWDAALRSFLLRYGVDAVPDDETIDSIRNLSHRRYAVEVLGQLQQLGTIGTSVEVHSLEDVRLFLSEQNNVVMKAPWSSSGRGIRFVNGTLDVNHERWIDNVINRQGSVIVEPYYNKVKDMGMEFESDGAGTVRYIGLSLFQTKNGAYTGNILASEEDKLEMISRYVPISLLVEIKERLCGLTAKLFKGRYRGPFGVDMMVVATPDRTNFLLHPCVEINVRRTMGHVALDIPSFADGFSRVMQIVLTDKYRIQIRKQ